MSWITDENLDPKLQDWAEAYKELCGIIKTKLPEIKHVDLYYGQDQVVDRDGNWMPFRAPAVFLQMEAAQVSDLGDNTQQLLMDVTMYLCVETVQDTNHGSLGQRRAMEFVALLRKLHVAMHGASGEHFSPLSRVGLTRKADAPPYMYMYAQTYRCVLLDNSTSKQWDFAEPGTLGLEIEPYSAPPVDDRLVVVRNSDGSYSVEVEAPGTHNLPDVTHTDSDGTPAVRPAMVPFVATLCAPCLPGRVMSSDEEDAVPVVTVPPGADVPLPRFIFAWTNKEEEVQTEINPLGFNGTFLTTFPDPMPRFEVRRESDSSVIGTGDMTAPVVTVPSGRVMSTNGLLPVMDVPPGVDVPLPQTVVRYVQADGSIGETAAADTLSLAGTLRTASVLPRFTVFESDGVTPHAYRDIASPSFNLPPPSGIAYALNFGLFSWQTGIARSGDEGWLYANGFFDYLPPPYPTHYTRLVNFFTLYHANIHGNTNRFTDRDGGQVYADRIIQDHYTGIEWYSPVSAMNGNWNAAIDGCVALNVGGNADWRLPPLGVLRTIIQNAGNARLSYTPFGIDGVSVHSSTSNPSSTANSLPMLNSGAFQSVSKTTSARYIACRRFV